MNTSNKSYRYTKMAIFFHWLSAILILSILYIGYIMVRMEGGYTPFRHGLFAWHKWLGVTVLLLAIFRLLWRFTHSPPAYAKALSPMMLRLARLGHFLLYALMVIMPLSGILMAQSKGYPVFYLGLKMPTLVQKSAALGSFFSQAHVVIAYTFLVLIIGHILMALKHHFFDRDKILSRMNPFSK